MVAGRPPTTGRFRTRRHLVDFVFNRFYKDKECNMNTIAKAAEVSQWTVKRILFGRTN